MNKRIEIDREEFLVLPAEEIRRIVLERNKPVVGIFVADGNRRLVMCQTRLSPTSEEFYKEYARIFVDSLKESLNIFFSHGLKTLFFPLFGPSLLLRKNKFQSITIPATYRKIFESDEWLKFYKENGIRVKAYGDLSQLEKIDVNRLNMGEGIMRAVEKTASHDKHTLFFGFMSENTPGLEMPQLIIDFYKSTNREPSPQEMIEIYYGEPVAPADFFIMSGKLSDHGALPPLISTLKARMYYFLVPGFLGLNITNYRRILYDLIFGQPLHSPPEYNVQQLNGIETLDKFYRQYRDTIIGIGKQVGDFWVLNI